MDGKGAMGIGLVVVMGIVIFGIVAIINSTLGSLDEKCAACSDDCEISACNNNTSATGRMFSWVLIGIYVLCSAGILYFSFKKEEKEPKVTTPSEQAAAPAKEDEFAYG